MSDFIGPRKRRTRQHVIADQSVHYLEGFILDEGFTAHRFISDYGYDLLMRTYDEHGWRPKRSNEAKMIRRTNVTYGQLDKVLRGLGFAHTEFERNGKGVHYDHYKTGASIVLPLFPKDDFVLDYHLVEARTTLDGFGIADPSLFDAKLKKAG